jgi:hypothetical protein
VGQVYENLECQKSAFPSRLIKASTRLVNYSDQDARYTSIGEGLASKQKGREETGGRPY